MALAVACGLVCFGRRKKVLSKSLRVIFLSVLVLAFSILPALADDYLVSGDEFGYTSEGFLTISKDVTLDIEGHANKASFDKMQSVDISGDATSITATVILPTRGRTEGGTIGTWSMDISADEGKSKSLTIQAGHENSGIVLGYSQDVATWKVGPRTTVKVNAPIRALSQDYYISLEVSGDNAVMEFGEKADIIGSSKDLYNPTGFYKNTPRSSFDVEGKGKLIISNKWALTGSVDVTVSKDSTLVLNFSGTHNLKGASIDLSGIIQVDKDITLTNGKLVSTQKGFVKTGKGTLTLGAGIQLVNESGNPIIVSVDEGKLLLAGDASKEGDDVARPSFKGSFDIRIHDKAELEINNSALRIPDAGGVSFDITGSGKLVLNQHAIRTDTKELYPHDGTNYNGTDSNSMNLLVKDVKINVSDDASQVVVKGIQAINAIKGSGTITVEGSTNVDDAVLILVGASEDNYVNFKGTITGTNVGLYDVEGDGGTFAVNLFKNATLNIDNLLVYGRTKLKIDYFSKAKNAGSIYLRSFRPDTNIGARLEVGSLVFVISNDNDGNTWGNAKNPIVIKGLRVDAVGENTITQKTRVAVLNVSSDAHLNISNVELYANKSNDYKGTYPSNRMEALTIAGGGITWDGANTKGDGVMVDGFYPIKVMPGTSLTVTGKRPFADDNSVLFSGGIATLNVAKGAGFGGNVLFDGKGKSTFKTTAGKTNREHNDAGEYSVLVDGNLVISTDSNVSVDVEFEADAFEGIGVDTDLKTTAGHRFKIFGTNDGTFTAPSRYTVVEDALFGLQKPASLNPTYEKGIILNCQEELVIVQLGEPEFIKGGADFGLGERGEEFAIKVPYDLIYRGVPYFFQEEIDEDTKKIYHYLGIDSKRFYAVPYVQYTGKGVETKKTINDSEFIDCQNIGMLVEIEDHYDEGYFMLVGTATEERVNITLTLGFNPAVNASGDVIGSGGHFVPATQTYELLREGLTPSAGKPEFLGTTTPANGTDFVQGTEGNVEFMVEGLRIATYESATPALVGNTYVWNNKAANNKSYYIPDKNGTQAKITNLRLIRYNGEYNKRTTISEDLSASFDCEPVNGMVSVPVEALGTLGNELFAYRGLAILADRDGNNGQIVTTPVTYTLRRAITAEGLPELDKTVTIGGDSVGDAYDVNPDDLSGDIKFELYEKDRTWLKFTPHDRGFTYETLDLTDVAPESYTFNVLAYNTNSSASSYKLYTFTITVEGEVAPTLTVEPESVTVKVGAQATAQATAAGIEGATFTIDPADGIAKIDAVTGAITVDATGFEAGTYEHTVKAGELTATFTVVVEAEAEAEFEIERFDETDGFDDAISDHTYYAIFQAVNAPEEAVTWTLTDNTEGKVLHSAVSGDLFIVEGTVKAKPESAEDTDQSFTVTATSGGKTATFEYDAFEVEADEITADEYKAIDGAAGEVKEGYQVFFPEGIVVDDEDAAFLPVWLRLIPGTGDNEDLFTGVEFAGVAGNLKNGEKATVVIEAVDADDEPVYYKWDVTYAAAPADLELAVNPATVNVVIDDTTPVTATLTATNAQGTVTYEADVDWVRIDQATGVVTFAPTEAGNYTVTFTATDSRGEDGKAEATVAVTATTPAPVPGDESDDMTLNVSKASVAIDLSIASTDTVTLSVENNQGAVTYEASESWVTIDQATGVATFAPTATGDYTVTFTATDAEEHTAIMSVAVNVTRSGKTPGETPGGETPGGETPVITSPDVPGDVGSSGGGCDAGFGALALALAAPLFLRRRRS